MDRETLNVYDRDPKSYADDWDNQPAPTDLHDAVRKYFHRNEPTADIGCGAGRDTAWLNENGYPAIGYDASEGLLGEARARHPGIEFHRSALPRLEGVASGGFANVLCETVIMHLPPAEVGEACTRLVDVLRPGGVLYLTWRVTDGSSERDAQGRLYASFDVQVVLGGLSAAEVLYSEQRTSASSRRTIHVLVARRRADR